MHNRSRRTRLVAVVTVFALLVVLGFAAPPTVTPISNATTLANALIGAGVTLVGTPTLTEAGPQAGTFTGGPALIGFSSGIILSSGDASSASGLWAGQNLPSTNEGGAGDSDLNVLTGGTTYDAAVLTFSFTPNSSTIYFQYTFASAEYPVYIGSYNDGFAFFVNGTNYALLPGTSIPVSINNVNMGANSASFNKYNGAGDELPYGGETKQLTFTAPVNPGVPNTIKIAVADALDHVLDSAVFIKAGTLSTTPPAATAVPALSGWGLAVLGVLLAASCALVLRRASGPDNSATTEN